MRKSIWIAAAVTLTLYLWVSAYMLGDLWSYKKNTEKFIIDQCDLNNSMARVIEKLVAATEFNYEFNDSNKKFIQNVAELYVPDEVALLRRIPAKQ